MQACDEISDCRAYAVDRTYQVQKVAGIEACAWYDGTVTLSLHNGAGLS